MCTARVCLPPVRGSTAHRNGEPTQRVAPYSAPTPGERGGGDHQPAAAAHRPAEVGEGCACSLWPNAGSGHLTLHPQAVVAAVDIEEEALTNGLMKQLTTLMKEKQALVRSLASVACRHETDAHRAQERELQHEHELHEAGMKELSIAFSERVSERSKLKTERCQLENLLEAEQESIIHRAHGQISLLLRDNAKLKRECDRLRGLGVSRSVSPALSHGHPSPAASPRTQIADPPATALP